MTAKKVTKKAPKQEVITKNIITELMDEIKQDEIKRLRESLKSAIVSIHKEQKKRDVWIERRQKEKEILAQFERDLLIAAERGDRETIARIRVEIQSVARTASMEGYQERYHKNQKPTQSFDPLYDGEED